MLSNGDYHVAHLGLGYTHCADIFFEPRSDTDSVEYAPWLIEYCKKIDRTKLAFDSSQMSDEALLAVLIKKERSRLMDYIRDIATTSTRFSFNRLDCFQNGSDDDNSFIVFKQLERYLNTLIDIKFDPNEQSPATSFNEDETELRTAEIQEFVNNNSTAQLITYHIIDYRQEAIDELYQHFQQQRNIPPNVRLVFTLFDPETTMIKNNDPLRSYKILKSRDDAKNLSHATLDESNRADFYYTTLRIATRDNLIELVSQRADRLSIINAYYQQVFEEIYSRHKWKWNVLFWCPCVADRERLERSRMPEMIDATTELIVQRNDVENNVKFAFLQYAYQYYLNQLMYIDELLVENHVIYYKKLASVVRWGKAITNSSYCTDNEKLNYSKEIIHLLVTVIKKTMIPEQKNVLTGALIDEIIKFKHLSASLVNSFEATQQITKILEPLEPEEIIPAVKGILAAQNDQNLIFSFVLSLNSSAKYLAHHTIKQIISRFFKNQLGFNPDEYAADTLIGNEINRIIKMLSKNIWNEELLDKRATHSLLVAFDKYVVDSLYSFNDKYAFESFVPTDSNRINKALRHLEIILNNEALGKQESYEFLIKYNYLNLVLAIHKHQSREVSFKPLVDSIVDIANDLHLTEIQKIKLITKVIYITHKSEMTRLFIKTLHDATMTSDKQRRSLFEKSLKLHEHCQRKIREQVDFNDYHATLWLKDDILEDRVDALHRVHVRDHGSVETSPWSSRTTMASMTAQC